MSKALRERPLDFLYFVFFAIHIPATLCLDLQAFYPERLVPSVLKALSRFYINISNDPAIQGSLNLLGHRQEYIWMKSLLFVEAVFQLPVFFIALYALWYDDRRFWVLLLIYGASTTTTLVPVLAVVLAAPSYASVKLAQVTLEQGQIALTSSERLVLLSSYLPFLFIPLTLTIDMALRVSAWNSGTQKLKAA